MWSMQLHALLFGQDTAILRCCWIAILLVSYVGTDLSDQIAAEIGESNAGLSFRSRWDHAQDHAHQRRCLRWFANTRREDRLSRFTTNFGGLDYFDRHFHSLDGLLAI